MVVVVGYVVVVGPWVVVKAVFFFRWRVAHESCLAISLSSHIFFSTAFCFFNFNSLISALLNVVVGSVVVVVAGVVAGVEGIFLFFFLEFHLLLFLFLLSRGFSTT